MNIALQKEDVMVNIITTKQALVEGIGLVVLSIIGASLCYLGLVGLAGVEFILFR
jgi:hypothetical protein